MTLRNVLYPTDVVIEFDHTSYTTMEGEDVMFRIVKRTDSSREVTVVFSTSTELGTATGMCKRELLNLSLSLSLSLSLYDVLMCAYVNKVV